GLRQAARISSLASLSLGDTNVTAGALKDLARLPKLGYLYLEPNQLTDENLRVLGEIGMLHTLTQASGEQTYKGEAYGRRPSSENEIFVFDLSRTPITDGGLKALAGLKNLARIDLNQSRVTGAGLKDLAALSNLKELDLSDQVTDAGLKEIA